MPITETREEYFARHGIEPCRECLKCDTPGSGIAPVVGQIMLELHIDNEIERLSRLEKLNGIPDKYDSTLKEKSRALSVRAGWLVNQDPANEIERV